MPNERCVETLRVAERRLQAAQLASDVPVLAELIDDSAWFTGPDGSVCTKGDDLRAHESGQQVLSSVEEEDLRALATEHAGVTWFLGTLAGTVNGRPFRARMRYIRAWVNGGSGWRIIAAHAALVTSEASTADRAGEAAGPGVGDPW